MNLANFPFRLKSVLKTCRSICVLLSLGLWTLPVEAQSIYSESYTFSTLAGYSGLGSADGVGNNAQFYQPFGVAVDSVGNIFVTDTGNNTIRRITPSGVVSTIAGFAGNSSFADGTGAAARFAMPIGIAVDKLGNVIVADELNQSVRKIALVGTNWIVSTIAWLPDRPNGLALDSAGNIFVTGSSLIWQISILGTNWSVMPIAGLDGPFGIAIDSSDNIFIADSGDDTIRMITHVGTNWVTSPIAGLADVIGAADGTNGDARFDSPYGISVDDADNLYVADTDNWAIRKITHSGTNWIVSTLAGSAQSNGSQDGTGSSARFFGSYGVATGPLGNVYVADTGNNTIRKVTSAGVVTTIAGNPPSSASVDGTGSGARFFDPQGLAVDGAGNIYVADTAGQTVRMVTAAGVVSTLAGYSGRYADIDGVGQNAAFAGPCGIAVDGAENLFVYDGGAETIREVTPAGVVSTIASLPTASATWGRPGVAVDSFGSLYVADAGSDVIRKVTQVGTNWDVTTIAGSTGIAGSADGTNGSALFNSPSSIAIDQEGVIFVADTANFTVREITHIGTNWVVNTIAGLARVQGSADGKGSDARFSFPCGIAVDENDNVYVADTLNHTIRKLEITGTNWLVSTIGGLPAHMGSADGAGNAALFDEPYDLAVDAVGNVYVADSYNNAIRKGTFTAYGPTNVVAYTQPSMNGQLVVTLLPLEAEGQWRFPWEPGWHNSGDVVSNLVTPFNYPIVFRSLSGYLTVSNDFEVAVTGGTTTYVTNVYYPTLSVAGTTNAGSLTVNIQPNAPSGSGWRFLGETPWRAPGSTASNLPQDVYFIEFEPVSGYSKPASQAIEVYPTLPTVFTANYLLAQSPPGGVLLPELVPVAKLNDMADYPFGFNGQLQTDVGYGSGVAVQQNVVLTAAHLVFNDQTLSYVSQAWWYFQQETGVYQPKPLLARGWYVLSGYASERTNDLLSGFYTPGQSSPQSRNFDVAALYFLSPVAGGGYGGYLPSDASPNTWLTSTSLKMLVGYPVDGSLFGDASIVPGTLYQTDPQPYPLTLATDPVDDQQVYLATWLLSYSGNSGGPLYVQYNGYYYPAGVYLGTLFSGTVPYASLVRAIDSNVVNMITFAQAASQGDIGTNGTGGGVITIIPNQSVTSNPGYIQWQLGPSAAVQAGAGWRLQGDPTYSTASNYTEAVNTTNVIVVEFKPIAGWNLPTNQTVAVLPGQLTTYSAFYTVTNPVLVANAVLGIGITGTTGTVYQIESRSSLASGTWIPVSTNTILSNGFNLILPPPALPNQMSSFYRAVWLP